MQLKLSVFICDICDICDQNNKLIPEWRNKKISQITQKSTDNAIRTICVHP